MSATAYFVLVVSGRTEIDREGPFLASEERDAAASDIYTRCKDIGDNVFWLDVNSYGEVKVGAFTNLTEEEG